jgi:hypothetical protein
MKAKLFNEGGRPLHGSDGFVDDLAEVAANKDRIPGEKVKPTLPMLSRYGK